MASAPPLGVEGADEEERQGYAFAKMD